MKEKEGKIGILFGAGAEVCFCMPSGAEFAMMIFSPEEKIIEQAKKNFKNYYFPFLVIGK